VETVVVQRRLKRNTLVVGPAPTLLAALVCFELGGVAVAVLGAAAVVAASAVLAEVAPATATVATHGSGPHLHQDG
jgi:hypothetical protein